MSDHPNVDRLDRLVDQLNDYASRVERTRFSRELRLHAVRVFDEFAAAVHDAWPHSEIADYFSLTVAPDLKNCRNRHAIALKFLHAAEMLHNAIEAVRNAVVEPIVTMPPHTCHVGPDVLEFAAQMTPSSITIAPAGESGGWRARYICPACETEQVSPELDERATEALLAAGCWFDPAFVTQQLAELFPQP